MTEELLDAERDDPEDGAQLSSALVRARAYKTLQPILNATIRQGALVDKELAAFLEALAHTRPQRGPLAGRTTPRSNQPSLSQLAPALSAGGFFLCPRGKPSRRLTRPKPTGDEDCGDDGTQSCVFKALRRVARMRGNRQMDYGRWHCLYRGLIWATYLLPGFDLVCHREGAVARRLTTA